MKNKKNEAYETKHKNLFIRFSTEQYEAIRKIAYEKNISMAEVVRTAINKDLGKGKK